jgi:hypothetical protein
MVVSRPVAKETLGSFLAGTGAERMVARKRDE